MIELAEPEQGRVRFRVIGVGNAGGMIVKRIARERLPGVECAAVNTAIKDLGNYAEIRQLQIGATLTKGHGAGMDPAVGRKAAQEDANRLRDFLGDNDVVVLVAGLGKGTGTGATPVVAELARESGALTLAMVTTPAAFERRRHHEIAAEGLKDLRDKVDAYVPLSNQKLFTVPANHTFEQAYAYMDDAILSAIRGVVDVLLRGGRMSYDLADLKTLFKGAGLSAFACGTGKGDGRVATVARELAEYPLLDGGGLASARSLLLSIAAGPDLEHRELEELCSEVERLIGGEPTLAPAIWQDESLAGEVRAVLLAGGLTPTETPRSEYELFPGREATLRGSVATGRPATGWSPRPARGPADTDPAGSPREENTEVPAYLRRGRSGPASVPRP